MRILSGSCSPSSSTAGAAMRGGGQAFVVKAGAKGLVAESKAVPRYMYPGSSRFTFESTVGMADHNSFDKTPELLDEAAEGLWHGRRLGARGAAGLEGSKVLHGLDDPVSTRALGLRGGERDRGESMGCTEGPITPASPIRRETP